jgi:hypothetical protein
MPIDAGVFRNVQPPTPFNGLESLGQILQLRQQRDVRQQQIASAQALEEERRAKLAEQQEQQQARVAIADAYRQAFNPEKKELDRPKFQATLMQGGYGQSWPEIAKALDDADKTSAEARAARTKADEAELGYASTMAKQIHAADFDDGIIDAVLTHAELNGHDVKPLVQLRTTQPERFKALVTNLAVPASEQRAAKEFALTLPTKIPNAQGLTPSQAAADARARESSDIARENLKVSQGNLAARWREVLEKPKVTPNEALSATMRLRNDFRTETKSAQEVNRQYELMKSALQSVKDGREAAGSQGVLVTFQKILDPTSVVRESEYARSSAGQSYLSRMQGTLDRIQRGGAGVPVSELEDFVKTAEQFAVKQREYANVAKDQIEGIARRYGLEPSDITRDLEAPDSGGSVTVQTPSGPATFPNKAAADAFKKAAGLR